MSLHGTGQGGASATPTTLTGPVTGTGTGTVATTITAKAVTYAKIQDEAATSLLGNPTGAPAAPSEITAAGGLAFSGTTLTGAAFMQKANNLSDVASVNASAKNLQAGYVLAQSGAVVSHTGDTAEFTLATITVPANALGANGQFVVEAVLSSNSGTNSKTQRIRFGATQMASNAAATQSANFHTRIANRGATNSQVSPGGTGVGTIAVAPATSAIDTTANADITITGQLSNSADTITLESYQVILYPKA